MGLEIRRLDSSFSSTSYLLWVISHVHTPSEDALSLSVKWESQRLWWLYNVSIWLDWTTFLTIPFLVCVWLGYVTREALGCFWRVKREQPPLHKFTGLKQHPTYNSSTLSWVFLQLLPLLAQVYKFTFMIKDANVFSRIPTSPEPKAVKN